MSDKSDLEDQSQSLKRKPKKRKLPEYSYSLDSDQDEHSVGKKMLPSPPLVEYSIQSVDADNLVLCPVQTTSTYTQNRSPQTLQTIASDIGIHSQEISNDFVFSTPCGSQQITARQEFGGFENYVVRKLKEHSRLLKEQNQLLMQIQRKLDPRLQNGTFQISDSTLQKLPLLPVACFEDFESFEESIVDEEVFLVLLKKISNGGWSSVHHATYGALKMVTLDSVACNFNWAGVNRRKEELCQLATSVKVAFRSTKAKDLVFGPVGMMVNYAKNNEIEKFAKDWLKAAPGRHAKRSLVN